jgi:cyclopropane-fatty-acyl-phospholipid synthase
MPAALNCAETDSSAGRTPSCAACRGLSLFERWVRTATLRRLSQIQGGAIRYFDPAGCATLGRQIEEAELVADWNINRPDFYRHLVTSGSLGVAESYLRGDWEADDLTTLLRILCRNLGSLSGTNSGLARVGSCLARAVHWANRNTRRGSRENISRHYDLSNEFFELFLDPTWMYSAARFDSPEMTLEEASVAKLESICRKAELKPGEHVLEIGTGWGGFALHAVRNHGVRLTTTTISRQQLLKARERVRDAGIGDYVELLEFDYRDLLGSYDKIVSIEMIEAVGERFLDDYFRQCGRLLKPGGKFVLQGIVMPEQRYDSYRRSVDFIQKYIFPGGFLPSVAAMQDSVGRTSNLRLVSVEDLSNHYALTLREWRRRFFERIDDVRALGFDDRFIRMWEYYLCYCEAAFLEQAVGVVQVVWDKPNY